MARAPIHKIYQGSNYLGSVKDFIHAVVLCDWIENSRTEVTEPHPQIRIGHRRIHIVWDLGKAECQELRFNGVTNYDFAEAYYEAGR
jgi:hypothetical protein|tara:strand:+ start:820 stop:1080 length:261 start_codon:yes stop_codon:yes gene_type:complete